MRFHCRSNATGSPLLRVSLTVLALAVILGCARTRTDDDLTGSGRSLVPAVAAAHDGVFRTHDPLSAARLAAHVAFLADGERAGRFTGTDGIEQAELYIAEHMALLGLKPAEALDDFFHRIDLYRSDYDPEGTSVRLLRDGRTVADANGLDIRPLPVTDFGTVAAPLTFAGYGITAPEHDWDDYRGLDVEDRIVFLYRYEPGAREEASGFKGAELTEHSLFLRKANNARERGALGMIVVTGPKDHSGPEDLRTIRTLGLEPHSIERRSTRSRVAGFPAVLVSQRFAYDALLPLGIDLEQLQRDIDSGIPAAELDLGEIWAEIAVSVQSEPELISARNVVGVLEADAADREGEEVGWIVIGAHHDHLGSFGPGPSEIYHGADDNASGVAGVIELAAYFAHRPRRVNMAFVAFTAEEEGLLGSRAFVRDEVVPPDALELMVNLDMIGRNPEKPVRAYVSSGAAHYIPVLLAAAEDLGLEVVVRDAGPEANSDQYPFHRAGAPVVSVFTGLHEDYHRPGDTADLLDYERMESILRVTAESVVAVHAAVEEPERPPVPVGP